MSFEEEQITFFAQTDARGQNVPFGIKAKDRTRHVYVIGKTGMGKSTLLENMAIQDIKNGNGLAFIDPHGQTAETLLDYIPESRKDDVLYFAPFDTDNPVSFNVMEDVGPDRRHLVVSGLMSVFKKIWVDAWSARMEYILSNTLMALLEYPGSTLLGVNRMLSDKNYRKKVVDNIKDPSVRSFWVDEFAKYNERYMQEAGDAIKNKIGQFTANPLIRNIVGQPKSSFDIREIMDQKKILIMNLSKGLVGESNANLLGSMLTTRIYLAAMSRADMGQEEMRKAPNFYFYVDEFQSFANATFANILSEARKYKLNLTIAHQYIEQMEEEVRNAVFGNVGTIISFRVGPFDAEILETVFTPKFLAPDIVNLGFAQIYLTLMIDGIGSQPFSATTLPPIKPASISAKEMVIHRSRQQFSKIRADVEKAIILWHEPNEGIVTPVTPKEETAPVKKVDTTGQKSVTESIPLRKESSAIAYVPKEMSPKESRPQRTDSRPPQEPRKSTPIINRAETPQRKEVQKTQNDTRVSDFKNQASQVQQIQKKFPTEAPKNTKSLDDLRAVLRSLSTTELQKKPDALEPLKNQAPENEPHQNKERNTNNSEAVHKVDAVKDERPAESISPTVEVTSSHTVPLQVTPVVEKEVVQTNQQQQGNQHEPHRVHVETFEDEKEIDDPLSPKKLERMMRVTGGDKTPLG